MTTGTQNLSPELKELLQQWCKAQEAKYGPDWKSILAKEMSAQTLETLKINGALKNVK